MKQYHFIVFILFIFVLQACVPRLESGQGTDAETYYTDKALVLLYHDVSANEEAAQSSTMSARQFEDHMTMLITRGFRIISMDDFVQFMLHGKAIPPNAVVLTFDDGYESFYTEVFPILKKFEATASNFIIGISSDLFDPGAIPHLSWDQMREMKALGMGLYNHTYNLHRMVAIDESGNESPALSSRMYISKKQRNENEAEFRNRIFSDIQFLQKRLDEELGKQPKLLAFPYGVYDDASIEEARKAGIELFFTIEEGINKSGSRMVKRINAGEPYISAEFLWNHIKQYF